MHKYILKIFKFLKDFIYLFKILAVFSVFVFFIFWAQNLACADWKFIDFIEPYLNACINFCSQFVEGEIPYLNIYIKYSYIATFLMYCGVFVLAHITILALELAENLYNEGRVLVKSNEEKLMNQTLKRAVEKKEKKIRKFKVYVSLSVKDKFMHPKYNVNLEEQVNIMNKFIMEQTFVNPVEYQGGFVYNFTNFNRVDDVLKVFTKILKTDSPFDYRICVQAYGEDILREDDEFNLLISTKIPNKIILTASTAYRYQYNPVQKLKTCQLGIYQKNGATFEVHFFDVE